MVDRQIMDDLVATGLIDLDDHLGGLRRGEVTVVAGERDAPFDFATSVYVHAMMVSSVDALLVSASMPQAPLEKRLQGISRGYEKNNRTGPVRALLAASKRGMRLRDLDELGQEFGHEFDMLIVDDIGSIRSAAGTKLPAGVVVRQLKRMAEDYRVHVLSTSGLAHDTHGQEDRRPDLANVDPAVADAVDTVLLAYQPSMFGFKSPEGQSLDGVFEVIVGKGENWTGGSIFLSYDPQARCCFCFEGSYGR